MVQLYNVHVLSFGEVEALVQLDFVLWPSLRRTAAPGIINQNLPHELGGNRDKMGAIYGQRRPVTREPEVDFVNKLRALQCVIGTLSQQAPMSGKPQFFIDERDESLKCLLISASPAKQQLSGRI